jgi:hypothetical protein
VVDTVWKPREGVPIEPLEMLIRAARQLIPLAQGEQNGGQFTKTLSLDLADWGNPSEVTVRCAVGRQSTFAGRTAVEYLFAGSLTGGVQYRSFRGQAFLDVDTGAVLAMEFDTDPR